MMNSQLSFQVFRPESDAEAVVFTVHGMQEHKERYEDFARYLNSENIACITYDLPGHGKTAGSEDNKGWFGEKDGWKSLVGSAVDMAQLAQHEFPAKPVVFFGHSMGTMIGRVFLETYDGMIDAMILSGAPCYNPGCILGKKTAEIIGRIKGKKAHSYLLDTMATGSFSHAVKNPRTPLDWLSYNEKNVDDYIADDWCGFPFTVQGYQDLFELMIRMNDVSAYRCMKPQLPVLFFAGEDDPCIGGKKGFENSISVLRKAGYENVESRLYPHMRHETMHEDDAETVMKDTAAWIHEKV